MASGFTNYRSELLTLTSDVYSPWTDFSNAFKTLNKIILITIIQKYKIYNCKDKFYLIFFFCFFFPQAHIHWRHWTLLRSPRNVTYHKDTSLRNGNYNRKRYKMYEHWISSRSSQPPATFRFCEKSCFKCST